MTNAQDSLRIAVGYYDRLLEDSKLTPNQQLDMVKFGAHHLAEARKADPTATFATLTPKGLPVTYTQEFLSAQLLYFQAVREGALEDEEGCLKSLETLKQASAYTPENPFIHRAIAEVLLKLNRRHDALTAARFALALDPSDIKSRMFVDKVTTTPSLGVPEQDPAAAEVHLGTMLMIAAPIGFICMPYIQDALHSASGKYAGDVWGALVFFGLIGLFALGWKIRASANTTRYLHKALQKDFYK